MAACWSGDCSRRKSSALQRPRAGPGPVRNAHWSQLQHLSAGSEHASRERCGVAQDEVPETMVLSPRVRSYGRDAAALPVESRRPHGKIALGILQNRKLNPSSRQDASSIAHTARSAPGDAQSSIERVGATSCVASTVRCVRLSSCPLERLPPLASLV